jgi:predicted nucleic acid-binding protein
MRVVVDASAVIPVLLAGGGLGPLAPHELVAPPLIRSEAVSMIRELAFRGTIPEAEARSGTSRLDDVPLRLDSPAGHHRRAFDIAVALGWAKTYDAEYVALAQALDVPLVTMDDRLARGASRLIRVLRPIDLPPS